jgi:hypothetical protein
MESVMQKYGKKDNWTRKARSFLAKTSLVSDILLIFAS